MNHLFTIFKENTFLEKRNTYTLRGLCMISIILHHIHTTIDLSFGNSFLTNVLNSQGYLSTGIFFLLSGYGLTISINNHKPLKLHYLFSKLWTIFSTFLFAYLVSYVVFTFCGFEIPLIDIIKDICTLTIHFHFHTTWFLKVIFFVYLTYITLRYFFSDVKAWIYFTALLCIFWLIAKLYLPAMYNTSILNFALGMILVPYKDYVYSKHNLILFFSIVFFIIFEILDLQPIISLSYSIIVIILFSYFSFLRSKFLEYIGKDSLIFYLGHLLFMRIPEMMPENKFIFIIIVFSVTTIIAKLYDYYKKYIADRFTLLINKV